MNNSETELLKALTEALGPIRVVSLEDLEQDLDDVTAEDRNVHQWRKNSERLLEAWAPKAAEYGSQDLAEIGKHVFEIALGPDGNGHPASSELDYNAGVYFYLIGKLARWHAALQRGQMVSQDTIDDIITYGFMALHDLQSRQTQASAREENCE